jgi:DNA-binding NarL/FixJ family response regulator
MAIVQARIKIKLLIADDHAIFRDDVRKLLDTEEAITIVGEARNGAECIKLLGKLKPDILLLDLHMPIRAVSLFLKS